MGSLLRAQAKDTEQNMGNQRRQKTLHSKRTMSIKKVMYVIFFTNQGPAIQIAVPKGKSVNARFYKGNVKFSLQIKVLLFRLPYLRVNL